MVCSVKPERAPTPRRSETEPNRSHSALDRPEELSSWVDKPEYIRIKLKESARYQKETTMKIRRTDTFKVFMENFASALKKDVTNLRFVTFDGQRIVDDDTPESLELEDDDLIDVLEPQQGGFTTSSDA
ncbi:hypothetical protein BJ170DRAFT_722681 [Xylariales sp. AK1849]|nr:hypothetical protein BJ170DRAFT_722681 [Xylariales sp. AK1849]